MSVLKSKRTTSSMEFVNTANKIYVETINFLSLVSARYARLMAQDVAHVASEVVDYSEKANAILPNTDDRTSLRRGYLDMAKAALSSLDVKLTHVYLILSQNPQGAFTKASGKTVDSAQAKKKLDNMAQSLGEKIDTEKALLEGQLKMLNKP